MLSGEPGGTARALDLHGHALEVLMTALLLAAASFGFVYWFVVRRWSADRALHHWLDRLFGYLDRPGPDTILPDFQQLSWCPPSSRRAFIMMHCMLIGITHRSEMFATAPRIGSQRGA
jgi:hypothetical protein